MNYQNNSNNGFGNTQPNQSTTTTFNPLRNNENSFAPPSNFGQNSGLAGQQSSILNGSPQGASSFLAPANQSSNPANYQTNNSSSGFDGQQQFTPSSSYLGQQSNSSFYPLSQQPNTTTPMQSQSQSGTSFFVPSQQQNQNAGTSSYFRPLQQSTSTMQPQQSSLSFPSSTGTFAQFLQNQQQGNNSFSTGQNSVSYSQPNQTFLQNSLPPTFLNSYQSSLQSSTTQSKNQELIASLDEIESSYNVESPNYKFNFVFYNIVETPFSKPMNFPQDLWNKYFIPNSPLMPVLLNKNQLDDRKKAQNELIHNLAESRASIFKKLDSLRIKREMIKNKLDNTVEKFRMKVKKYVMCDDTSSVYKLQVDFLDREKLYIRENKEEVVEFLTKMYHRVERFDKKVTEAITNSEKKIALTRELNKNN